MNEYGYHAEGIYMTERHFSNSSGTTILSFILSNHPVQQYFRYIISVSFIGGGNWSTHRKLPTCCCKSM